LNTDSEVAGATRRRLSWPGLVLWILAASLLPAIVSVAVTHGDLVADELTSASVVMRSLVVPQLVAVAVVAAAITRLRWWDLVLHEPLGMRRWVWMVPISLAGASLALVDRDSLREIGATTALALLLAVVLIGVSEELMYRGLVLRALRDRFPEVAAAAVTALLFGALHLPRGPVNALSSAVSGYLFYACRRVSGGIVVAILVHAVWDFSLLSTWTATDDDATASPLLLFLLSLVLLVVLVIRRRAAEPAAGSTPAAAVSGHGSRRSDPKRDGEWS
jgi:hypothetical protein